MYTHRNQHFQHLLSSPPIKRPVSPLGVNISRAPASVHGGASTPPQEHQPYCGTASQACLCLPPVTSLDAGELILLSFLPHVPSTGTRMHEALHSTLPKCMITEQVMLFYPFQGTCVKIKASKQLIKSLNKHALSYYSKSGSDLGTGDLTASETVPALRGTDGVNRDKHNGRKSLQMP